MIEAESWAYHGGRAAFDRDVRRYTAMVQAGWRVVRFLWDDVRQHSEDVRAILQDLVVDAAGPTTGHPGPGRPAQA